MPVLRPGAPFLTTSLLTPTFLSGESYSVRVEALVCLFTDLVPPDLKCSGGFPNPSSLSPVIVAVLHQHWFATALTSLSTNIHPLLGSTPCIHPELRLVCKIRRHLHHLSSSYHRSFSVLGGLRKDLAFSLLRVSSHHLLAGGLSRWPGPHRIYPIYSPVAVLPPPYFHYTDEVTFLIFSGWAYIH